jgi:hypothetical protein
MRPPSPFPPRDGHEQARSADVVSVTISLAAVPARLRHRAAVVGALVAVAAAVGTLATPPAPAEAASRVIKISPSDVTYGPTGARSLAGRLQALRPGDTLVLGPGVYNAGYTRPNVWSGTSHSPIVVTASNPGRTLIKGQLKLWDASYWQLRNLRIQATVKGSEALYMGGGRGWLVAGGEFFGGRATGAYANVAIGAGNYSQPQAFRFTANCVHGAGRTARENQDHNIYVNFPGSSGTSGSIDHNVIFDHPNGVGIKIGAGGEPNARGPWNVRVTSNTVSNGGRQILLHGNVRGNVIQGNLLAFSTKNFQKLAKTTAIYANMLTTRTNRINNNYVYASSFVAWDPDHKLVNAGDNRLRGNPVFKGMGTCGAYQQTAGPALAYGRYGNARF